MRANNFLLNTAGSKLLWGEPKNHVKFDSHSLGWWTRSRKKVLII